MLIKERDDNSIKLKQLEGLLQTSRLTDAQRKQIEGELKLSRSGAAGEKDAAYYINFYLRDLRIGR